MHSAVQLSGSSSTSWRARSMAASRRPDFRAEQGRVEQRTNVVACPGNRLVQCRQRLVRQALRLQRARQSYPGVRKVLA